MSIESSSASLPAVALKHFQSIYDRHCYLDLYSLTSSYWNSSTEIDALPLEALILGGRLADRLGGHRLARWLLRRAYQRDPSNPRVRYFTRHLNIARLSLLDELKAFVANPDIGGDDDELRSSWYATHAFSWATLRDFDRAYDCIRISHSLSPDDSWVFSLESGIYGMADRWSDALQSAQLALEADPGAPFALNSLGRSLINLGRVEESAGRMFSAAESCQSYHLVLDACWHQCALAETVDGAQRNSALDRARMLADRLPTLMPLADRESLKSVARRNLDIAELADDYDGIEHWTAEVHSQFHRQLLDNLTKNPEGKRIRLPFRRAIQKHGACVPTSVAAAMSAGGIFISADEMASEITFGGTAEWAAADWLRARGYHVRFFSATPEIARSLIQNQIAFIVSWEAEESGHAVAVVGLDERAGTLLVHDPQSFRCNIYLLTVLDPLASPLGIKGMAVVNPGNAAQLDALLPPESIVIETAQDYFKQLICHGISASREVAADLLRRFPSHAGAQYLDAVQTLESGQVGQALGKFRELLKQFPNSPVVRVRFISACRALGDTAMLRQTLKDIVETGVLPGVEEQQDWIYPPDRYIYEYADLLRLSTDTRHLAESLLLRLIGRQWASAGAWHNLADLLWQKRDMKGALLSYRISSCLSENNEHFAIAYADALAAERKETEAFEWLESRARRFQNTPHAINTWISWIVILEECGYPERALAACNEALAQQGAVAELLSFAVPFFARMGDWTRAEAELERLRIAGLPRAFVEAATHLHQMRGDFTAAARSAAAWIAEVPRSIDARYSMLDIIYSREGAEAAVRTSLQWMRENRDHEDFEAAYCKQLDRAFAPRWKRYSVLLRRLRRNPEDAWGWRELTFNCLYEFSDADDRKRKRLEPRIAHYLAECDRTSAGAVQTVRTHALWAEYRGDWAAAIDASLDSIMLEPETFFGYRHAWECSSRLNAEEREALWNRIEPILLSLPSRLSIARDVMGLLAERFGAAVAEKTIENWRVARPDDPDVIEAAADLLVDHGHGRSDAARAISMLEPAVLRYPYHSGLRLSLARAYRRAGRDADAEAVLVEIARRHPTNSYARTQLAWIKHRRGDSQGAFEILDAAPAAVSRNAIFLDARVQMLIENARFDEAIRDTENGLEQLPWDVNWRERAIALFIQCGADERAIRAARRGVELNPRGAYAWLLLGRTLNEMRQHAEVGEIESCLRRSLELNCTLFEAADLLASLLIEQRRYDDASKILHDIEPRMTDPSPARGRSAWIRRRCDEKDEAVADLANVVAAFPWYHWGWSVLMDWLVEDASWNQARELLQNIPPPMFTNTEFRLRRLLLLEETKMDVKQLDEEWDSLLRDFPEDVSLHLRRYDDLSAASRWKEAAAVIDTIEQIAPDDPFVMARRCEVLSRDKNKDAALEIAMRICFRPVEEYSWPADKVWEVARTGGFDTRLAGSFIKNLLAGNKPTLRSFRRMAACVMKHESKIPVWPFFATWFPRSSARELIRLVHEVSKASWNGSDYRAQIYAQLCDYGYHSSVIRLSTLIGPDSVTGVHEWAEIGRALINAGRYAKARKFLRAWREHTGVAMWMVANYILSLTGFQRDRLRERCNSARDALAGLPHDRCAKYLAHVQAEASALLGNDSEFLDTWNSYARYFDGKVQKDDFFALKERFLLTDIPSLARHVMQHREWRVRIIIWRFRVHRAIQTIRTLDFF